MPKHLERKTCKTKVVQSIHNLKAPTSLVPIHSSSGFKPGTVKAGNVVTFGAQNNFFLRISFR
jgi:hypothetical protein